MNFILLSSLKQAAAVRTASLLYNDREIDNMLTGEMYFPSWKTVETKTAEKLSFLLPPSLQETVAKNIRTMHHEVDEWKRNHEFLLEHLGPCCSAWLSWKTDGTIDRIQTAKEIVVNENIDQKIRFIMACTYFLESEIIALWERIKNVKNRKNKPRLLFKGLRINCAVRFWIIWLKDKSRHWSEMVDEYYKNTRDGEPWDIPERVSCYFPFISKEKKQRIIPFFAKPSVHADDFITCVNRMDQTERIEAFKLISFPYGLKFCLKWPYRSLFIKMAKEAFTYMTLDEFLKILLFLIGSYVFDGDEDYHLLEEFRQISPTSFNEQTSRRWLNMVEDYLEDENCPQALKEAVRKCYFE